MRAHTVSDSHYHRGKRLVIYDAGPIGDFDCAFAWWTRTADGLTIRPNLPFLNSRTDVLVGPGSKLDIRNINLLATLLVHAQCGDGDGYWSELGRSFIDDLLSLLDRHLLTGLVDAPWVCSPDVEGTSKDHLLLSALQELTAYAAAEATRLNQRSQQQHRFGLEGKEAPGGILHEMRVLLATYRAHVTSISESEYGDAK